MSRRTDSTVRMTGLSGVLLLYCCYFAVVLLVYCCCFTGVRLDLRIEWISGRLDVVKVIITLTLTVLSGLRKELGRCLKPNASATARFATPR